MTCFLKSCAAAAGVSVRKFAVSRRANGNLRDVMGVPLRTIGRRSSLGELLPHFGLCQTGIEDLFCFAEMDFAAAIGSLSPGDTQDNFEIKSGGQGCPRQNRIRSVA